MNAIAFSLYGTGEVFLNGLMENLRRLPRFYAGWVPLIFTDGLAGEEFYRCCEARGARVIYRTPRSDTGCMFWRFEAVGDEEFEAVIVRDADSLIGAREPAAVRQWFQSGAGFHMMHDSPHHWGGPWPILGGMWGARRGVYPGDFPRLVRWWLENKGPFEYAADQWFLQRYVWPYAMRDGMRHTSNPQTKYGGDPFPVHANERHHVGARMEPAVLPHWSSA